MRTLTPAAKAERLFSTFAARLKHPDTNLRSARYVYWVRDTNLKFYRALCSAQSESQALSALKMLRHAKPE